MTPALTAAELLSVWERGRGQTVPARALLLAGAAANAPPETVAALSVGQRDSLLLALRVRLFGARLLSLTACPQCAHELELDFAASEITAPALETLPETLLVEAAGYEACSRLPNGGDLIAVVTDNQAARGDAQAAACGADLLARCLRWVRRAGDEEWLENWAELPPALIAAIAARMEQADPQANVQLDLRCADCGHRWLALFDIVAHLWSELDDWARRTLREVHLLATAYSWREADILALSAQRRQLYLEMIGQAV